VILYPASNTVVERDFDPSENAVTVVAIDYNGLNIPITTAAKVDGNTWRATLSIPATAPVCSPDTGYYRLIWTHSTGTVEQDFQVVAYDEGVQRPPPAGFGVFNVALRDEMYLPLGATDVMCEILNLSGSVQLAAITAVTNTVGTPTPQSPGSVLAVAEWQAPIIGVGEYLAHWSYQVGGATQHEYRQAFVISTKTASMLSSFKMFIDQSQMTRWLGHFSFHEVELIDCLYRGADRINVHPPQQTSYSPDSMPQQLTHALRVASLHEMLNRLYLAEGLSTFDFQGGSIQVNVDRTPFIQTKMDELGNWLDSNLTTIKGAMLSRSSIGHLHVSVSYGGQNNNFAHNGRTYIRPSAFMLARGNMGGLLDNGVSL
jgi:hypothetical protein